MKYLGNKTRLITFIDDCINSENIEIDSKRVLDLFAGTGSVSLYFKSKNCDVDSVDLMNYSAANLYFYNYYNNYPDFLELKEKFNIGNFDEVLYFLKNNINKNSDYYFQNYAPSGLYKRQYFTDKNAKIIDNIMNNMSIIKPYLPYEKYMFLSGCVMNAFDRVANIAGTYGTYLKIWRSMALKDIIFEQPQLIDVGTNRIFINDVNDFCENNGYYDIVYLDPPYNKRQYAPNFHVLENIVNNDRPILKGKSGLINYENQKSKYCSSLYVKSEFQKLINNIKSNYIIMSYSTEGLLSRRDIKEILDNKGNVKVYTKKYRRFKTNSNTEKETGLKELLFICKCYHN